MIANIPMNSYAGFGWGPTMKDTEIVVFLATNAENNFTTYKGVDDSWPNLAPEE